MLTKKFLWALPLIAILLSGCNRNTAEKSSVRLKILGLGAMLYSADNYEHFPDMSTPETVKLALFSYLEHAKDHEGGEVLGYKVFVNPSTGRPYQPNTALSKVSDMDIDNPASTVLFYEDAPYDDGTRGVIYADGHYGTVPESVWPDFFATHTKPVQNSTTTSSY